MAAEIEILTSTTSSRLSASGPTVSSVSTWPAGSARILLDRPPANVLSIEMMEDIVVALESLIPARRQAGVFPRAEQVLSAGFGAGRALGDRSYVMRSPSQDLRAADEARQAHDVRREWPGAPGRQRPGRGCQSCWAAAAPSSCTTRSRAVRLQHRGGCSSAAAHRAQARPRISCSEAPASARSRQWRWDSHRVHPDER